MSKKELATQKAADVIINPAVADKSIVTDGIEVVANLNNPKLAKLVKEYYTKSNSVAKTQWDMVSKVGAMCTDDLYKSDFANWKELGAFLGVSSATMSLTRKLSKFDIVYLKELGFTVSNAFELTKISPDNFDTFMNYYEGNPALLTQKELRAEVKVFCDSLKRIETETDITDNIGDAETETKESLTDYDDTAKELICDYTLPMWCNENGGYVVDQPVQLTESESEKLAKLIRKFFEDNKILDL